MDLYDDLLRGVRGDSAIFDRSVLAPPWEMSFAEGSSLTLCSPLRGTARLTRGDDTRVIQVGETAIMRGPEPFTAGGEPGGDEETVLLVGTYRLRGELPRRLLSVLPPALVVPDQHGCAAMRDFLEAQLTDGRPGRQIVLDRLLDWLLVCTLRDWFDLEDGNRPGWYRALSDEIAGPVLRAMHAAPEQAWTLASLAAEAGVSRTTLAKHFTETVGRPPMAYLTDWRMARAADLLAGAHETTVATVARRVGYADAFGFSSAFKRVLGVSPSEYRRLNADPVDGEARLLDR
ncbi:AraC family transcriptional regulator [Nonomuraea typhae]|uniref:AraC family transcriptional regulator n=1 Tax=Nonomuraea typhae TaxID=2603600 RepID=UPI0012FA3057|nr:AraC family transcriptional regulator [Nonomuraea typhae]